MMAQNRVSCFTCPRCQKVKFTQTDYNRHLKIHIRAHKCLLCPRAFGLPSDLERHKATHGCVKLECPVQGCAFKGTRRKQQLLGHLQRKHSAKDKIEFGDALRRDYDVKLTVEIQRAFDFFEAVKGAEDDNQMRGLVLQYSNTPSSGEILKWAVKSGNEKLVRLLIQAGEDVHSIEGPDHAQTSLLRMATENNDKAIVSLLLEGGAAVNSKDRFSFTPLHSAARHCGPEIIQLLVDANANLEAEYGPGTPLWWAALDLPHRIGKEDLQKLKGSIKVLIDAGAIISPRTWEYFDAELREEYAHLSPNRSLDPPTNPVTNPASSDLALLSPYEAAGPSLSSNTPLELGSGVSYEMDEEQWGIMGKRWHMNEQQWEMMNEG